MTDPKGRSDASASLFEDLPVVEEQVAQATRQALAQARHQGPPRLLQPNRQQVELRASDLESLLDEDHRARLVWGYVERQDLSRLLQAIKAPRQQRGALGDRSAHPVRTVAVRCQWHFNNPHPWHSNFPTHLLQGASDGTGRTTA